MRIFWPNVQTIVKNIMGIAFPSAELILAQQITVVLFSKQDSILLIWSNCVLQLFQKSNHKTVRILQFSPFNEASKH